MQRYRLTKIFYYASEEKQGLQQEEAHLDSHWVKIE